MCVSFNDFVGHAYGDANLVTVLSINDQTSPGNVLLVKYCCMWSMHKTSTVVMATFVGVFVCVCVSVCVCVRVCLLICLSLQCATWDYSWLMYLTVM
jgi:hypothetical protein